MKWVTGSLPSMASRRCRRPGWSNWTTQTYRSRSRTALVLWLCRAFRCIKCGGVLLSHLLTNGIPRVRPEVAAVRAAYWAGSDRQAALILCLAVQQRIVTADALRRVVTQVGGRRRRAFLRVVIADLADGAQSLGELDFAAMCRRRGLPEPDRQVIRRGPNGRIYLDVRWSIGLVVEIDGAQHRTGLALTQDNLRQNAVTLTGDVVLRVDLIGLRVRSDQFMDQVCQAHAQLTAERMSAYIPARRRPLSGDVLTHVHGGADVRNDGSLSPPLLGLPPPGAFWPSRPRCYRALGRSGSPPLLVITSTEGRVPGREGARTGGPTQEWAPLWAKARR